MDLTMQVVAHDGWTVVLVGGDVDLTTAPRLRERLVRLSAEGNRHLVLDLAGVGLCDSTGLGVLVGAVRRARSADGQVLVAGLTPSLARLFELTGLDRAIDVLASLDDVPALDG